MQKQQPKTYTTNQIANEDWTFDFDSIYLWPMSMEQHIEQMT